MRDNVYFILVKPVYLGNIGSVARVMKNFGFAHLRFVEPPKGYKDSEARRMSVGAFDLLKSSEVFESLDSALQDISFAIGTTSGQQRDMVPVPFTAIAAEVSGTASNGANKVAIVFGDERNGLTREELLRCHQVSTIPTDAGFPALNMAQAVAICAYELSVKSGGSMDTASMSAADTGNTARESAPTGQQNDQLFEQLGTLLDAVEFSRTFNRDKVLLELRSFYQRALPTSREYDLLRGALIKINQKVSGTKTAPKKHESGKVHER